MLIDWIVFGLVFGVILYPYMTNKAGCRDILKAAVAKEPDLKLKAHYVPIMCAFCFYGVVSALTLGIDSLIVLVTSLL